MALTLGDAILAFAPVLAVAAIAFGPSAAWLAARRHRNPAVWLVFGVCLGPIALALVLLAPPATCPACSGPTSGFETACRACGFDLRLRRRPFAASIEGAPGAPRGASGARPSAAIVRGSPLPAADRGVGVPVMDSNATGQDAGPDRLSAVGAQRPRVLSSGRAGPGQGDGSEMTMLAIGVYVRGSEKSLVAGMRYLIARTDDRLRIIGPIDVATNHADLDLPLAGIEANLLADRLVMGGVADDGSGRTFVLAFQALAGMVARPVDDAIMELSGSVPIAAAHP